jgi:hypothetical protein
MNLRKGGPERAERHHAHVIRDQLVEERHAAEHLVKW